MLKFYLFILFLFSIVGCSKLRTSYLDSQIKPLFEASSKGLNEALSNLINKEGIDINARDSYSETALMLASKYGKVSSVKILIDAKADLDIQNKNGWTALMFATYYGNFEVAKLLIQNGSDINIQEYDGFTPTMLAIYRGNIEIANELLIAGADVNLKNKYGFKAIDYAKKGIGYEYEEIVNMILS